jgi:hypothetical protein
MAGRPTAVYELRISLRSPALLGGRLGAGGMAQTWCVHGNGDASSQALLPGSSVRGVLRHASLRLGEAQGIACARHPDGRGFCDCPTCELFGGAGKRGRLRVRSAAATAPNLIDVTRVAIDRQRRTAGEGLLWSSRLVIAAFDLRLELDARADGTEAEPDTAAEHLRALLNWLEAVGIGVGRAKSTMGRADIQVREVEPARVPRVLPSRGPERSWKLVVRALEPVRLAALRDRPFFQHGKTFVPASTLVGAIGWGLARAGCPELAEAAFLDGNVWLSEAWPVGPHGYDWRASARECERCERTFDVAVEQTVAALAGRATHERCPHCDGEDAGARPRRILRKGAGLLVSGHTAIDPFSGRVQEGLLYQQQLCEPGSAFVADLLAPEWVADAIAELGELVVGGARSRGLGLATVTVEPASATASVEDRLAWVRGLLERHEIRLGPDDDIGVFDIVTSAHVPDGIESAVAVGGCELVTGEAEVDLLGGWDERRDVTRSLREVVTRGSWLAVRGPASALAALEGVVVPDRGGWCPLWLRMRALGNEAERPDAEEAAR